jgi:hypothetical protein
MFWGSGTIPAADKAALIDGWERNKATYVDPNPNCVLGYACDAFTTQLNDILDTKAFKALWKMNEEDGFQPLTDEYGDNDLTVINGVPGTGELPFIFGDCTSPNSWATRVGPSSTAGTYSSTIGNGDTDWSITTLIGSIGGFVSPNAGGTGTVIDYKINNNNQNVKINYSSTTDCEFDTNFGISPRVRVPFTISGSGSFVTVNFDFTSRTDLKLQIWVDYVKVHDVVHAISSGVQDPFQSKIDIGTLGAQASVVVQYVYFSDAWFTEAEMSDLKDAFDRNQAP